MRKVCFLVALLSFLLINPASAKENTGFVRGSYVNLRADKKFNSPIVGKKMRGDTYKVLFEDRNWVRVEFADGVKGWLYRTLVERSAEPESATVAEKKEEEKVEKKEEKEKLPEKKPEKKVEARPEKKQEKKTSEVPARPAAVVDISGSAEELYNEAIELYEKKKYIQALEKNELALRKAPQNAEIINNIGNCQFKLGRVEDALNSWKNALKISPRSGKICNNLGIAYYQLDKNKDAIEYYQKAILFEPEFPDPYYNLASVYGFTGKFNEAITNYKKFLEFSPDPSMKKLSEERIAYCERQVDKKTSSK